MCGLQNAGRTSDVRIAECRKRGTSEERRRPGRTPRREKSGEKSEERGRSRRECQRLKENNGKLEMYSGIRY